MGRTPLQDAVPMTLGQEFNAFASLLKNETEHLKISASLMLEVNLGATAIGTGAKPYLKYLAMTQPSHLPQKQASYS